MMFDNNKNVKKNYQSVKILIKNCSYFVRFFFF